MAQKDLKPTREAPKPRKWLSQSSPDQVAELLIDIDPEHAARVAVALAMRLGPESLERGRAVVERARQAPGRVALDAAVGALRNLMR